MVHFKLSEKEAEEETRKSIAGLGEFIKEGRILSCKGSREEIEEVGGIFRASCIVEWKGKKHDLDITTSSVGVHEIHLDIVGD